MYHYPADIYTEPEPDVDALANLGPLASMAGVWSGAAARTSIRRLTAPNISGSLSATNSSRSTPKPMGRNFSTGCAITH